MQSLGIQPRRPNRCRRRKRSPGAKSRMFIFTDTARLSRKLHYHCRPHTGAQAAPEPSAASSGGRAGSHTQHPMESSSQPLT